jgi:hypothetical protein
MSSGVFTARSNFRSEHIKGNRLCHACGRPLQGAIALVTRWSSKKDKNASLAVCDEDCWQDLDHNFWLNRAAKKEWFAGHEEEAEEYWDSRLPVKQFTHGTYMYEHEKPL